MDSMLVANQLNGIWKIKNRDLWPIYADIKELAGKFESISYQHVYREHNSAADAMVNQILDERK
jgi:ribonuclease HI